jgi:hypothetical protein
LYLLYSDAAGSYKASSFLICTLVLTRSLALHKLYVIHVIVEPDLTGTTLTHYKMAECIPQLLDPPDFFYKQTCVQDGLLTLQYNDVYQDL